MKSVTLRYGVEVRNNIAISSTTTIGQIIGDQSNKVILGYGDNVKALVNGVEQSTDVVPFDGAVIQLETRANSKAS